MRGSVRAFPGIPLALGHPTSTSSGEAAPSLHLTEREEHLLGLVELCCVTPGLWASMAESLIDGGAVNKNSSL